MPQGLHDSNTSITGINQQNYSQHPHQASRCNVEFISLWHNHLAEFSGETHTTKSDYAVDGGGGIKGKQNKQVEVANHFTCILKSLPS